MWNLAESEFLSVEPLCATFRNLNLYVEPLWNLEHFKWSLETFNCGTFMWDLGKPGARFPPNHPKALLEEPQAFQAVGEQCIFTAQRQIPNVFQGGIEHVLWQEFPCIKSHHSSVLKGLERLGLYRSWSLGICLKHQRCLPYRWDLCHASSQLPKTTHPKGQAKTAQILNVILCVLSESKPLRKALKTGEA